VKITVLWGVTSCTQVDRYRRFWKNKLSIFKVEDYSFLLKMEAVHFSETIIIIHQITRCHTPEDSNHYNYNREKLKPCKMEASGTKIEPETSGTRSRFVSVRLPCSILIYWATASKTSLRVRHTLSSNLSEEKSCMFNGTSGTEILVPIV
jgi:hypothetical protein